MRSITARDMSADVPPVHSDMIAGILAKQNLYEVT